MTVPSSGTALLLLLLDSRSPSGGHNHSAGMEPAVSAGWVRGLADVEDFCRGRLLTAGVVAAAFAAAACCDLVAGPSSEQPIRHKIAELDVELEARTPSEALRAASRALGRGLARLVRATLPDFVPPWDAQVPHQPIVLGAAVAAAGGTPQLAARAAALATVSVPASAAVRLLGLDPFAVQALLARLAVEIDALPLGNLAMNGEQLPAWGSPALDLLADYHRTTEVRLFAS
jgi:urease accessory protein